MVRARLMEINGKPARTSDYESERAKHMITREFNLSWAEHMQADNALVAGSWWSRKDFGKPMLSMESKAGKNTASSNERRARFRYQWYCD